MTASSITKCTTPAQAIIKAIFTPAGTGSDAGPVHNWVFLMNSYNFMTPIDESTTRYYWFQVRNFDQDNEEVSRQFDEDVRHAFAEDRVVLAAVHQGAGQQVQPQYRPGLRLGTPAFPAQPLAKLVAGTACGRSRWYRPDRKQRGFEMSSQPKVSRLGG